ncbi:MAG: glycosyltransferase family 39 protein [Lysobacterales bacterium]|nr:MAG: glycosyltransferase family 39 protein [Xanthomonadales bacterium]
MTIQNPASDEPLASRACSQSSPSERSLTYAVLAILSVALGLRLWGIGFGLPYDFTPDEVHEIVRALKLGAGEYSWTAGKGGLYYFLFAEYGLLYVFWWITGQVSAPADFALRYVQDPSAFYLAGRITVAVMGTLTCWVVYLIGKRLYDWRVGLAAALIGATAHYHGLWSHYINVDIGMTLAVWASILAYIEYERVQQTRWLVGAGVLGGIAFAFKLPGAIVALPLLLAIATASRASLTPRQRIKEAAIVLFAMLVTSTAVAPENIVGIGSLSNHFSDIIPNADAAQSAGNAAEIDDAVQDVSILHDGGYLKILIKSTYLALTIAALLGAAIGIWRRQRWDIIWCMLVAAFLGVMTVADRPGEERYLVAIVPALWLLAARGAALVAGQRGRVMAIAIAVIVVVPLFSLIRQDYMFTRPDTRVLAKEWIEANVSSGAKILIDGMRYRLIQSPPLNPDESTVERRVSSAGGVRRVSRGVSQDTLALYTDAMSQISGPKYDLHSTVYGLDVKDLSYYPQECFDYIITSSQVTSDFVAPSRVAKYPTSARFYQQLPTDPRFNGVYSAEPVPWKIQGPAITVYEVSSHCG